MADDDNTRLRMPVALGDDLIREIFLRGDSKFLGRCLILSKMWKSIIEAESFSYEHLNCSSFAFDPHLVRLVSSDQDLGLHFEGVEDEDFRKVVPIPYELQPRELDSDDDMLKLLNVNYDPNECKLRLISYSNGLVCFGVRTDNGYERYLLWNHFLNKYFIIPKSKYYHSFVGFEYYDNDYKIVGGEYGWMEHIEIYSLRKRDWKPIVVNPNLTGYDMRRYARVDHVMYFMGLTDEDEFSLLSFNLKDDTHSQILLPESLQLHERMVVYPIAFGDNSVAVMGVFDSHWELWAGDSVIPTLLLKTVEVDNHDGSVLGAYGVWKGRNVLLQNVGGRVTSYELNAQLEQIQEIRVVRELGQNEYSSIARYHETLTLIEIGTNMARLLERGSETDQDDDTTRVNDTDQDDDTTRENDTDQDDV